MPITENFKVIKGVINHLHGLTISSKRSMEFPAMNNIFSLVQFAKNLSPPSE